MVSKILHRTINIVPWRLRSVIRHVPLIAPFQRYLLSRLSPEEEFLHTIDAGPAKGLRYPVVLPQDKAIWIGNYEETFATAVKNRVRPGTICFDVGGYHGFFAGLMGLAGASTVITFEPFPPNRDYIQRVIRCNRELPIEVMPYALGDRDDNVSFNAMPDPSMGKWSGSNFQPGAAASEVIAVPMRRLDSLISSGEVPVPDLIKIDIEGAELEMLEGTRELLESKHPALFIETHSPRLAMQCDELLRQHSYEVRVLETETHVHEMLPEVVHLQAESA
jgi:FkbM family methyltransferase